MPLCDILFQSKKHSVATGHFLPVMLIVPSEQVSIVPEAGYGLKYDIFIMMLSSSQELSKGGINGAAGNKSASSPSG